MALDQMRFLALMALLSVAVYLVDGLLVGGLGGGLVRVLVIVLGIITAVVIPPALRWLVRLRLRSRPPALESLKAELAKQTSAQGVAGVLVERVRAVTDATAVTLYLEGELWTVSGQPTDEPTARFPLGSPDRPVGEIRCHGNLCNESLVLKLLRVGGLALQNALLAERASAAEERRSRAQAQRDLQHRLTWTVTTQVCTLLEETRERLETVRLCAGTLPANLLARDLEALSESLRQLEAFVHDNLKNASSVQAPVSRMPLAPSSLPR